MRKKPRLHPSFQPSIYNKRRRANFFIRNTDGVAAIEFAIVLPVFLTLAMGIITYGLYFGAAHSTAQLAADAARASVAGLSDSERTLIAQQHIEINAKEYVLVDPTSISVEAGPLSLRRLSISRFHPIRHKQTADLEPRSVCATAK